MQGNITITSHVKEGKLTRNRNLISKAIKGQEGNDIEITIKKQKRVRSNNQNRYYWAVLIPIAQQAMYDLWGEVYSSDRIHDFFKNKFLFHERYNEETGEVLQLPKSTTELTPTEAEHYYLEVRSFITEWFNTEVPMPNEDLQLNFK